MIYAKAKISFTIALYVFLIVSVVLGASQVKAEYSEKISARFLAPGTRLNNQLLKSAFGKVLNEQTGFVAKNKIEKRIGDLLNLIVHEHNSNIPVEDKANRLVTSGFVITEAKDNFIQEGGKLLARVRMTYEDGHTEDYIFKQEYAYAMDEIGYHVLKILGIAASYTKRYSEALFLIKPIGQFNLGKIQQAQYQNPEFMRKLSRLSGRAAARAFILGLADRKAENMRVILDKQGMPKEVINADLASSFLYIKDKTFKSSIADVLGILTDMLSGASYAGVSNSELTLIINAFLEGFEMQILEFQSAFQQINTAFEKINPDEYDRLDSMWVVLDNVKARSKGILERIDPEIAKYDYIRLMLFAALLNKVSRFFSAGRSDDFMSQFFEKQGVFFTRMQDLLSLLKENNNKVLEDNRPIFEEIFKAFNELGSNLLKEENYQSAILCDNLCIEIGKILIRIDQANRQMWQVRMNKAEARLREAIDKAAAFSVRPGFQYLFNRLFSTVIAQAI